MTLASTSLSWRVFFSTNGVKCHANKQRAECWAPTHRQRLHYAVATDRISSHALHEKPDIAQDKLTWLQRSDADCGNRYGVLPLCLGLPVQAREHLHRGDFKILRGCRGTVCGWSAVPAEALTPDGNVIWNTLPEFIFVRFQTRTRWRIPGIEEDNVFPVSVQSKPWFLDAGRLNPKLKITRYQFPLAPDFADTFHGAQGSTAEPGIIADLCGVDPIAGYIGMTRSRTRRKVLIYRPFPLAPFQGGLPLGRQLLLDVWKQEPVDWDALRKKYLDERPCQECGEMKRKDAFTKAQWKQDSYRVCKECTTQKREAGTPYRCTQCGLWHAASHFASKHQNPRWSMYRVCLSCAAKKQCSVCQKKFTQEYFSRSAWQRKELSRKICLQCQNKTRGLWTCAACHQRRPIANFSAFLERRLSGKNGKQMCNTCRVKGVQRIIRHRAATATIARLKPLRKRLWKKQILRETWAAIAQRVNATESATDKEGLSADNATRSTRGRAGLRNPPAATVETVTPENERRLYTCPFCSGTISSIMLTGQINHRSVCGNQFRVRNGQVTARRYRHTCPTCNATIFSAHESGRIRCKHATPNGEVCSRKEWQVHLARTTADTPPSKRRKRTN